MKRAIVAAAVLALGVTAGGVSTALAAVNPSQPKILLHVRDVTTKNTCSLGLVTTCEGTDQTGALYPALYHVHVIVAKGDSIENIAGVQFGILYDGPSNGASDLAGIDIFGWTLCATLEFQAPPGGGVNAWPNPNSGTLITWDAILRCQTTDITTAGFFYMGAYGPDELRIVRRQVDNSAKVADCASAEAPAIPEGALGFATFSAGESVSGCNPCVVDCAPVAVQPTTWSGIKTLLR